MYTQKKKSDGNQNRETTNPVRQKNSSHIAALHFVDNRTEAIAHRKLQKVTDSSHQARQLEVLQNGLQAKNTTTPGFRHTSTSRAGLNEINLGTHERHRPTIRRMFKSSDAPHTDTIDPAYQAILNTLEGRKDSVSRRDMVNKTILAAALIDANANLISDSGPNARDKVLELVGEKPSSGFDNESADTIRDRARVVLSAWEEASTPDAQLELFNNGFGNDPCLAARLNGIAEFRAGQLGITEEALSDATYDSSLGITILDLMYEKKLDDPPNWSDFLDFLKTDHPEIVSNPNFHATYTVTKDAYI